MANIARKLWKQWNWLPMPFGKHKGLSLPTILFTDPAYFGWLWNDEILKEEKKYQKELMWQFKMVGERALRILPANSPRNRYVFWIAVDSDGVFLDVATVEKGKAPNDDPWPVGVKMKGPFPVLDVSVFYKYRQPKIGSKRMASAMKRILFPYLREVPCVDDFERFMADRGNFAATDVTKSANSEAASISGGV